MLRAMSHQQNRINWALLVLAVGGLLGIGVMSAWLTQQDDAQSDSDEPLFV